MSTRVHHQNRASQKGNILILTIVSFGVIAVSLLVAYSFCSLVFINNRLQTSAGEIALAGAKKLNERDRIGQLNNMIARCRQLVYSSKKDYDKSVQDYPQLEVIAFPLLQESRDSANKLDVERARIITIARDDATTEMQMRFNAIKNTYAMRLPWLQVGTPQLLGTRLGSMAKVESNVPVLTGFPELATKDKSQGKVIAAPALSLYKGNANAGLDEEPFLNFRLSTLPAPVEKTIAPARILTSDGYKDEGGNEFFPSATQASLSLKVQTSLGFPASSTMGALGTASTTGGSPHQ